MGVLSKQWLTITVVSETTFQGMWHLDQVWKMSRISAGLDFLFVFIYLFYFTILYWFCRTLTWISHGDTCVPQPEPPSHLPPHPLPLGHPSAPALRALYHASNLDWRFISHMIIYMFQCHSPKSFYPCPLPQSPKDETGAYYTEWSKPERKTPIQYNNTYIWNLERW